MMTINKVWVRYTDDETGRMLMVAPEWDREFKGVADHWVSGGEIEYKNLSGDWVSYEQQSITHLTANGVKEFRIKQREPKAGEVWVDGNGIAWQICIDNGGIVSLCNSYHRMEPVVGWEYAASSVKQYYAKEILNDAAPRDISTSTVFDRASAMMDELVKAANCEEGV